MHLSRIGLTPVKGGRHQTLESVELTASGPWGDRSFCLVDAVVDRCLRTVENPTLLQTAPTWDGTVLAVELPTGTVAGEPVPSGEVRTVDYWGRSVGLDVLDGPWAAAYSEHLGRDVVLTASAPGAVVYAGAVSIVTDASLTRLAAEAGVRVDAARFRATFQVAGDLPPYAEDAWVGRLLRIGTAQVRVRGLLPRCAVIDMDPTTGERDRTLLKTLAGYRRDRLGIPFGVDGEVVVPGHVGTGDPVSLVDPPRPGASG